MSSLYADVFLHSAHDAFMHGDAQDYYSCVTIKPRTHEVQSWKNNVAEGTQP